MNHSRLRARLYRQEPLHEGAAVTLTEGQHHYLAHTLRVKEGEQVALFNGQDGEWCAQIEQVSKKMVTLRVAQQRAKQTNSPDIWLLFAPVKNEKIDFTARRATELGVSALLPVITQRTVVARVNEERLLANAIEAAEQCERQDLPQVHAPQKLDAVLAAWDTTRTLLFCDESGKGEVLRELLPRLKQGRYGVLIGPEGGFSPHEREALARLLFVRAVSLGPRILRAETAALAVLSNLAAWVGDWDQPSHFE